MSSPKRTSSPKTSEPVEQPPRLTATMDIASDYLKFKSRLALRNETIQEWANRMVKLELQGKLPAVK